MDKTEKELTVIDCKMDINNQIDTMLAEKRLSKESATELKGVIRYLNGNALFVVYLRWIEGYRTQRQIANKLGISEAAVSKIVQKKLRALRAQLIFMAEMNAEDEDFLSIDRWRRAQDIEHEGAGSEATDTAGDVVGTVVSGKAYVRAGDPEKGSWAYHGSTNPDVEPSRKDPDNIAAEAIRRGRAERKALALEVEKIRKKLPESG